MPTSRDAYRTNLLDKRPALFSLQGGDVKGGTIIAGDENEVKK